MEQNEWSVEGLTLSASDIDILFSSWANMQRAIGRLGLDMKFNHDKYEIATQIKFIVGSYEMLQAVAITKNRASEIFEQTTELRYATEYDFSQHGALHMLYLMGYDFLEQLDHLCHAILNRGIDRVLEVGDDQ